jgi:long-chain fatty acid transport protein
VTIALLVLGPRAAMASGFSVARFASEHGHPTTHNPTALYYNPAALRGERAELLIDALIGRRELSYARRRAPTDAEDPPGAEGANVGRAELDNLLLNPSIWFSLPATSRLVLGAAVFTPFGGPLSWNERESFKASPYPGPVDGVNRFHAIEGISTTSYASLGASYAVGDAGLRLGLAASLLYSRIEDVRAWSGGGNSVIGEGRSLIAVDGFDYALAAGIFYENRARNVRLGASYQSRPNLRGGLELRGRLDNDIGGPSSADVALHQDLPDIVRLGFGLQVDPGLELRASAAWERWSAFERQCVTEAGAPCGVFESGAQPDGGAVLQNVERDYRDALEARAGVSIWTRSGIEFISSIGIMSAAVPDATFEAGLPDFFGITFTLGGALELSRALSVAASVSQIVSPSRNVKSQLVDLELPSRAPDASGHYTQRVSYLDLNLRWKL